MRGPPDTSGGARERRRDPHDLVAHGLHCTTCGGGRSDLERSRCVGACCKINFMVKPDDSGPCSVCGVTFLSIIRL